MFFFYPPAWQVGSRCSVASRSISGTDPIFGNRITSRRRLGVLTFVMIHGAQAPKLGCLFPRWRLSQRTDWNGGGLPSLGIPVDTCVLLRPPGGVAAVSERPRCGPIGPSGYLLPGIRLLAALVVAHPRLGMAVGTEMALQLMSFVRGSRTKNFLKLPPLEISCVGGGKMFVA